MLNTGLHIISDSLSEEYISLVKDDIEKKFQELHDSELSIENFNFYTSVSAVFSSKIEGEDIELDSYIKHKRFGGHFLPDYTRKIDDLYEAYIFASQHKLSKTHIEQAHRIITRNILQPSRQGRLRTSQMFVLTRHGKIEYVAAGFDNLLKDLDLLYRDIESLLEKKLSFKEVFFYASYIHLVFVKIHPFEDGNGRTARLLEKWFISEKLGEKTWFIESEKYYYTHQESYYENLRKLGLEYDLLDWSKALPFLLMLPDSLF